MALKFLRSSLPTTIEIRKEIAGEIGIVNANPTQMHQVIMNLCTNASHAMQGRGILEVSLRNVDLDSYSAAQYTDIGPGIHTIRTNCGSSICNLQCADNHTT